mmetsp:Transcript_4070/g.25559  ORF Transcript_4070/g.25559 Transcript_4070/m.25559 type:complete len:188 (-) Transcript_4070:2674-3237(-)
MGERKRDDVWVGSEKDGWTSWKMRSWNRGWNVGMSVEVVSIATNRGTSSWLLRKDDEDHQRGRCEFGASRVRSLRTGGVVASRWRRNVGGRRNETGKRKTSATTSSLSNEPKSELGNLEREAWTRMEKDTKGRRGRAWKTFTRETKAGGWNQAEENEHVLESTRKEGGGMAVQSKSGTARRTILAEG